ncbi:hypothetical protein [Streptomyces lydicus]|uniref:hypothetical protein n=1 Tax=Streptomyces lydicus TaxID=47763 RepID=UPI0034353CCA
MACKDLNLLIAWINDYCRRRGRTDHVPDVSKRPWRLSTAQFRRTLAWFIGRRPGGSIAGAIPYRHLGVQIFEGYAGTSKAGFRAEAQQEALLARGDGLSLMVDRHEHEQLRGPSAEEARVRLDQFGNRVRFTGGPHDGQRTVSNPAHNSSAQAFMCEREVPLGPLALLPDPAGALVVACLQPPGRRHGRLGVHQAFDRLSVGARALRTGSDGADGRPGGVAAEVREAVLGLVDGVISVCAGVPAQHGQ